jgi:uncharacterized protein YjiS (DUF1127 family)
MSRKMTVPASVAGTVFPRPDRVRAPWAQGFWRRAGDLVLLWIRRNQTRRALQALDLDRLEDIGIDREAARREGAKPFWRA